MVTRKHIYLVVAVLVVASFVVASRYTDGIGFNSKWQLLGHAERTVSINGYRTTVSIEVYEVRVDHETLLNAVKDLIDHCKQWEDKTLDAPKCGLNPQLLEEYAKEGRLSVLAVTVKVKNTGTFTISAGGPGPYCGYSYNLDHLEDPALEPVVPHYKPVSALRYKVKSGKVVLGYGGICQHALLQHKLLPGAEIKTTYGIIVTKPAELVFEAEPLLIMGGQELPVEVNTTIRV